MALLWVWADAGDDFPDPMISHSVGNGKDNESSDVLLVQALLNIFYTMYSRPPGLPNPPAPGSGWSDRTRAYVVEFQSKVVKQKKPTGVVSPPPPFMGWQTALTKKFTVAKLIQSAGIALFQMQSEDNLVTFLKKQYPPLIVPFQTVRKGNTWTQPTGGTSEDFKSGGTTVEGVSTPQFYRN